MENHIFLGEWIADETFYDVKPRMVFHRQLDPIDLGVDPYQNSHVLFRKTFCLQDFANAKIYITADDYYKLYINGEFVDQGPAPAYHNNYNYNQIEVGKFLKKGKNVIAIHTYYQGLINRVWQSGDFRHGLIMDLVVDGNTVVKSDETFLTARHSGFSQIGASIMKTQFFECYDARVKEKDFHLCDFNDSAWKNAKIKKHVDYNLYPQKTHMLEYEKILPKSFERVDGGYLIDLGKTYVGQIFAKAKGESGQKVAIMCGQELMPDGKVRFDMRCCCRYYEEWILSGEIDQLNQFDYKSLRYVFIETDAEIFDVYFLSRHYPFELKVGLKNEYLCDNDVNDIFNLCVHSQKYGVQETIQDCMDREKGFYLGDGCYTALANFILTKDDSMARKLIDDAFSSSFITKGLVTCMDCSFMQEIAEYPLILADFILWHYNITKDLEYLSQNFYKMGSVVDFYKDNYLTDGLIGNLDRWCVVEWPKDFQDGYAVDITEGKVCVEPHVSINAYYLNAIRTLNKIAKILGKPPYLDETPLYDKFVETFYDKERNLFVDSRESGHVSLPGNVFPFAFGICPENFTQSFYRLLDQKGYDKLGIFTSFPLLKGLLREEENERILQFIKHDGTWKRMLKEGATSTFEIWGKDLKWNTSLYHLTFSFVSMFLVDMDLKSIIL